MLKSYTFTHYGHKLTITRGLTCCGNCINCRKPAYNYLENKTTGAEGYICDDCLEDTFED